MLYSYSNRFNGYKPVGSTHTVSIQYTCMCCVLSCTGYMTASLGDVCVIVVQDEEKKTVQVKIRSSLVSVGYKRLSGQRSLESLYIRRDLNWIVSDLPKQRGFNIFKLALSTILVTKQQLVLTVANYLFAYLSKKFISPWIPLICPGENYMRVRELQKMKFRRL